MDSLRRIIAEVHRRSLWQVLTIYLVGAWMAYQVVLGVTDGIGLPDWVPAFAFVLFVIGLPIVIATAFVNEGPPTRDALRGTGSIELRDATLFPGGAGDEWGAGDGETPAARPAPTSHWLTWRRSLAAGMLAFVLLGAGTTGFMGMRVMGIGAVGTLTAKGILTESDAIILADFSSADAGLGTVVGEALRIDLMQTTIVRVVDPARLREGMNRMQHDPATGLPPDVALQLAEREGFKAVLAGDVSSLGGSYILSARLLQPSDGAVLAAFKEVARDSTRLIDAVDALAKQIRAKAGESLKTVRASEPLWRVSTSSLAALRKYTEAERVAQTTGEQLRAVELLEEAVAIDPAFASAYRKIAMLLSNVGVRHHDRIAAVRKAYELRDRLPEKERLNAIGSWHMSMNHDLPRGVEAYRAVLALDPTDVIATNNLALLMLRLRRPAEAVPLLEPMVATPEATHTHFGNLAVAQFALGRTDDARATAAEAMRRFPGNPEILRISPRILAATGDYAAAEAELARVRARSDAVSYRFDHISYLYVLGRLRDGDRVTRELYDATASAGLAPQMLMSAIRPAAMRLALLGDADRALRDMRDALQRHPLDTMAPADRPYLFLASDFAEAGDFATAAALLDAYEREVPPEDRLDPVPLRQSRARLAMVRAPSPETIDEFRRWDEGSCTTCALPDLGRAYDLIGQQDSAVAVYTRYIDMPFLYRAIDDSYSLPFILFRLGELHEARGEQELALRYYGRLLDLWKDADPEFQPRIQAVRARVQGLAGRG
jgi:eukaryotic-like serine/threonine-protein kinase